MATTSPVALTATVAIALAAQRSTLAGRLRSGGQALFQLRPGDARKGRALQYLSRIRHRRTRRAGKFTFGSNGVGSIVHRTGVLLHKQAGIDVVHVPYNSVETSATDLMGGRIDVMYDPVTQPGQERRGLKGLVTTNPERNP